MLTSKRSLNKFFLIKKGNTILIIYSQDTGKSACQTGTTGGFAIPERITKKNKTKTKSIINDLVNKKDTLM